MLHAQVAVVASPLARSARLAGEPVEFWSVRRCKRALNFKARFLLSARSLCVTRLDGCGSTFGWLQSPSRPQFLHGNRKFLWVTACSPFARL